MKKFKIAVTLTGLMRFWDTTSKLLEHWNSLYEDIEFYFFLSTWDSSIETLVCGGCGRETSIDKIDYSCYNFLTEYEYLNPTDVASGSWDRHH